MVRTEDMTTGEDRGCLACGAHNLLGEERQKLSVLFCPSRLDQLLLHYRTILPGTATSCPLAWLLFYYQFTFIHCIEPYVFGFKKHLDIPYAEPDHFTSINH